MQYPQMGLPVAGFQALDINAISRNRAISEFLAAYPAFMAHGDPTLDIYQMSLPSSNPNQKVTVRITVPKSYPKDLPTVSLSPQVLPNNLINPSTGVIDQKAIIEIYQRKPSIVEIIKWISEKIGGAAAVPAAQPSSAPSAQPASRPTPVVPPKPVANISLSEPVIDEELNELCSKLSADELNQLVSDKNALADKYFELNSVEDRKNKLRDYIRFVQERAGEVIELKEKLKAEAAKYDNTLAEYEKIRKSIEQVKEEVDRKTGGKDGGVDSVLRKKRDRLDGNIQQMSSEFRKTGSKSEAEVNEFLNRYYDSMQEYNRCNILLGSLSNH
eukprot:TRINITY_DN1158_c0_g2_i1.p1 TRINITY_DN1158_c0_g2~~TRINITY_DN1158_c0_g2_i1.p1  ORF type:complete len:329 (-),score=89.67 TRINITY_DN1158_c0_g2_i1:77-1063(-)